MKIPIYIINNSIFLMLNIILASWFLLRKRKVPSIVLWEFQYIATLLIFINEIIFAFALYFWFISGIDKISWEVNGTQQTFYIIAENSKSVFRFLLLLIINFPRSKKYNG